MIAGQVLSDETMRVIQAVILGLIAAAGAVAGMVAWVVNRIYHQIRGSEPDVPRLRFSRAIGYGLMAAVPFLLYFAAAASSM